MKEIIHFYHTNDWHSHLENWPKFLRYYQNQSDKHNQEGEAHFLFDIGDAVDRQHPLTEATQGQIMVDLMNEMGVDVATIGNNEGIGSHHDVLNSLYKDAQFPVVLGNIFDKKDSTRPNHTQDYEMIQTDKGSRFAVFGMTAPFEISYDIVGWQPLDPIASIKRVIQDIKTKESFDGIILLSHLGLPTDRIIAKMFPEILMIFGAHTHHVLPEGEWVGHTLLTGGGKYGQFMGHLTAEFEKPINKDYLYEAGSSDVTVNETIIDYKRYFKLTEELVASDRISNYPEDEMQVSQWVAQGQEILKGNIVGRLPFALPAHEIEYSPLQHYTLLAMKAQSGADIAIINAGMFLQGLPACEVTHFDLHNALPHPIRLMMVETRLADYKQVIKPQVASLGEELKYTPIKGSGFRGNIFGQLVTIADQNIYDLDDSAIVKIVTIDHLLYLPFFTSLVAQKHYLWGQPFIRELLADTIHKNSIDGELDQPSE
ncbi:bifunctional metallophosphatase/5'-nucleotidase [Aerococcus agrisoli]|uniref:Bifunctional metallophosphatase/5'-nucleotidase n=1 Tax=Aerococcus agrisoli TaxID=2487350 RepID=A0A3N4GEG7_9LACT|nr:bifunctional UDP-sugar hydrolase/5'-nucleotidase [Aerococcus agrisoli]RPA61253.1 bifunctional metallophosphatase/5'-nucleotidase [Aerococcus agrisoli]